MIKSRRGGQALAHGTEGVLSVCVECLDVALGNAEFLQLLDDLMYDRILRVLDAHDESHVALTFRRDAIEPSLERLDARFLIRRL